MLEMVTCLTTPHVNIEAYAMRFTSNPTPYPEAFRAPRVGFKRGAETEIHSENNYEFIASRQMMCIAFSAGVIYRIHV